VWGECKHESHRGGCIDCIYDGEPARMWIEDWNENGTANMMMEIFDDESRTVIVRSFKLFGCRPTAVKIGEWEEP
jgi:hypothetical protein